MLWTVLIVQQRSPPSSVYSFFCISGGYPPSTKAGPVCRTACICLLVAADVHSRLLKPLVDSCIEVYTAASDALLPTPSRSHYTFSFRDVVRVMQVLTAISCSRRSCEHAMLDR